MLLASNLIIKAGAPCLKENVRLVQKETRKLRKRILNSRYSPSDNNSLIEAFNVEIFKFVALKILEERGEFKNKQFEYFRGERFQK